MQPFQDQVSRLKANHGSWTASGLQLTPVQLNGRLSGGSQINNSLIQQQAINKALFILGYEALNYVQHSHRRRNDMGVDQNKRDQVGGWRGAFGVEMGASKKVVFQECGLPRDWVEENFAMLLRRECQAIATDLDGNRNPKKYIKIPAGDVHNVVVDPPPISQILRHVPVVYQQGDFDTCFRDSLASALHAFGLVVQAKELSCNSQLAGCNHQLVRDASNVIRKMFANQNLVLVKIFNHSCSMEQIEAEGTAWPIVLVLMTSDLCYGTHAVTVWRGLIFDSNLPYALRWSQESLDWCSGKGSTCIGFSQVLRLCPVNFRKHILEPFLTPANMYCIGTQVWASMETSAGMGWIMRLPTATKKLYHVVFTDGSCKTMDDVEVATLAVKKHLGWVMAEL
jgi:hypothetical protein